MLVSAKTGRLSVMLTYNYQLWRIGDVGGAFIITGKFSASQQHIYKYNYTFVYISIFSSM